MRPGLTGETPITQLTRGDFTGEMSALRGSASFVRTRVREAGEVISMTPENLRRLVQSDAELSELFMRAFILRRMGLLEAQQGDVILVGLRDSASTLRIRQFLSRNAVPYIGLDADTDVDAAALLEQFHVGADEVPVVLCRDKVLRNPGNADMAECLGLNPRIDPAIVRDLVVIGAGPAGLAAAVYAASEGLRVLVLETLGPGGQAGASSKIENYLGFPTGISGQALAGRALVQAHKFGADGWSRVRPKGSTRKKGRTGSRCREDARYPRAPSSLRLERIPARCHCKTSIVFWASASTTPLRTSRRNSAETKKSASWAAATRPARLPCFCPAIVARCTCSSAPPGSPTACRSTSSTASRKARTSSCIPTRKSRRSTAMRTCSKCAGAARKTSRRTRCGMCS